MDSFAEQEDFPTLHCSCNYWKWFGFNPVFCSILSSLCDLSRQRQGAFNKAFRICCLLMMTSLRVYQPLCLLLKAIFVFCLFVKGWGLKLWLSMLRYYTKSTSVAICESRSWGKCSAQADLKCPSSHLIDISKHSWSFLLLMMLQMYFCHLDTLTQMSNSKQ